MPGTPLDMRATKMRRNTHDLEVFNLEGRQTQKQKLQLEGCCGGIMLKLRSNG